MLLQPYADKFTNQQANKELRECVDRFDKAATDLGLIVGQSNPDMVRVVRSFVVGCEYNQTANLLWGYVTATSLISLANHDKV
jgi:hypothetical protein